MWTVASYYLQLARGLRSEPRKHEQIWTTIAQGKPRRRDIKALIASAHLVSASLRLTAIEELLTGSKTLRIRAYKKFDGNFIHVYLRDQTSHPRVEVGHQAKWMVRKPGLQALKLSTCLEYAEKVQRRLKAEIIQHYRSTADIPEWITSDVQKWIDQLALPSKNA